MEPKPQDYDYDLDQALAAVVAVRAEIPADAFTAEVLGTQRNGCGVLIRADGLVLTVGYLVAEAETIWLTLSDGRAIPGHVLAYDHESGFGLIQALARVDLPYLSLGSCVGLEVGDPVVIGGAGGRRHSLAGQVTNRHEFAGYWEYVLDDAIFTAPVHDNWGGTALIGSTGELMGIGSLLIQSADQNDPDNGQNMFMPIDQLSPILDDLMTLGQPNRPPRPWLGLYATEIGNRIIVMNLASRGPAADADLRPGDLVLSVAGEEPKTLANFFRRIWSLGPAGTDIPLQIYREGDMFDVNIASADRRQFLKSPQAH